MLINSQAPDVPELAHQGIFQLSQLSVNCYVNTTKKCSLNLSRKDFFIILSVPQDHCGSHNNLLKFFSNFTFYGVYISINFDFRLNRLAFTDTNFFQGYKQLLAKKDIYFGFKAPAQTFVKILKRSDHGLTVCARSGALLFRALQS